MLMFMVYTRVESRADSTQRTARFQLNLSSRTSLSIRVAPTKEQRSSTRVRFDAFIPVEVDISMRIILHE